MTPDRTVRVAHAAASATSVRHRLRSDLAGAGVGPRGLDDAALVVSELVGNSVRHARPLADGCVLVQWSIVADDVLLQVTDGGGSTTPTARTASRDAVDGRGLAIVAAVATAWGYDRGERRSTIWARVPLSAAQSRRRAIAGRT